MSHSVIGDDCVDPQLSPRVSQTVQHKSVGDHCVDWYQGESSCTALMTVSTLNLVLWQSYCTAQSVLVTTVSTLNLVLGQSYCTAQSVLVMTVLTLNLVPGWAQM